MKQKKVVIFNGPPGVGKDFGVRALAAIGTDSGLVVTHNKMSDGLKSAVHKLFCLNYDYTFYDTDTNKPLKDTPVEKLFGLSPRQMYIKLSEEFVKPNFGTDAFGKIALLQLMQQNADVHAFSDGGFVDEWCPIVKVIGPEHVLCIEVHGVQPDGTKMDFSGDSRGYIGAQLQELFPDITVRKIYNEFGGIVERQLYRAMVIGVVKKFLGID